MAASRPPHLSVTHRQLLRPRRRPAGKCFSASSPPRSRSPPKKLIDFGRPETRVGPVSADAKRVERGPPPPLICNSSNSCFQSRPLRRSSSSSCRVPQLLCATTSCAGRRASPPQLAGSNAPRVAAVSGRRIRIAGAAAPGRRTDRGEAAGRTAVRRTPTPTTGAA